MSDKSIRIWIFFPNEQLYIQKDIIYCNMPLKTGLFLILFLFTLQATRIKGKPVFECHSNTVLFKQSLIIEQKQDFW